MDLSVLIDCWKTHAHTSLLTKQVATFLTMNPRITSTLIQKAKKKDLLISTQKRVDLRALV